MINNNYNKLIELKKTLCLLRKNELTFKSKFKNYFSDQFLFRT